jgi:hypothetical protein
MDAQRLTAEGASRPLSVPAGSSLDDESVCFLPAVVSGCLDCVRRLGPGGGATSTSQGHPRTIFRRALEHDNLVPAEVTARKIGRVTIARGARADRAGRAEAASPLRSLRRPLALPISRGQSPA